MLLLLLGQMLSELVAESVSDSDVAERALALFPREDWLNSMLSYFDESTQDREAFINWQGTLADGLIELLGRKRRGK